MPTVRVKFSLEILGAMLLPDGRILRVENSLGWPPSIELIVESPNVPGGPPIVNGSPARELYADIRYHMNGHKEWIV